MFGFGRRQDPERERRVDEIRRQQQERMREYCALWHSAAFQETKDSLMKNFQSICGFGISNSPICIKVIVRPGTSGENLKTIWDRIHERHPGKVVTIYEDEIVACAKPYAMAG